MSNEGNNRIDNLKKAGIILAILTAIKALFSYTRTGR